MKSVRALLIVFFSIFFVLLQGSYFFAQASEERWNYTMIDVADLQGANRYRISSASVVEVTRSRLETGELKYNYAIKEAAGQVAGQEQPLAFTSAKSWMFYGDPIKRNLRGDDQEFIPVLDFINSVAKSISLVPKRIGAKWQQPIHIGKGSEFLPGAVSVNFEKQSLSPQGYGNLILIKYSSEEMVFNAIDGDGSQVRASFSGFTTYDPDKRVVIHTVWDFKATKLRLDGKSDKFTNKLIYFMSDSKGETPVVPFIIYPELAQAVGKHQVRFTRVVSDPLPPEWFSQALTLSKMTWIITGITVDRNTNPFPLLAVVAVSLCAAALADSVGEIMTGHSIFKGLGGKTAELLGVDPKWGEFAGGVARLGASSKLAAVPALLGVPTTSKVVQVYSSAENVATLTEALMLGKEFLNFSVARKKIDNMVPVASRIPPQQIDWSHQSGLQEFKKFAKSFQPIAQPFVELMKPALDKDKLTGRTQSAAGDINVNVSFTQELSGLYTLTPDYFLAPGGNWTLTNISGTRTGRGSMPGTFTTGSGSGRVETTRLGYVAGTLNNEDFTIITQGKVTVSGRAGQPLRGTMTSTFNTYGIENVSLTGDAKIYHDGRLDWTNIKGDVVHTGVGKIGEVSGTINQGPTR